ncbi:MAG TPA: hypothetical protein VGQ39_25800 [Pyrinomonadaceae bacterium]|jgi:hypothetical protein|nr:hypothetical protein [Pyrinomonadaceae bacterium]
MIAYLVAEAAKQVKQILNRGLETPNEQTGGARSKSGIQLCRCVQYFKRGWLTTPKAAVGLRYIGELSDESKLLGFEEFPTFAIKGDSPTQNGFFARIATTKASTSISCELSLISGFTAIR